MSIIMNSFILVIGNTYNIRGQLQNYGFKAGKADKGWYWYKVASRETATHWQDQINEKSVTVCHVESLDQVK